MILLNFSHPLNDTQLGQIIEFTGQSPICVLALSPRFAEQQPFGSQMADLMAQIDLTPQQWQSEALLVVPPPLNYIAVLLLAELHGRMGYFPPVVRTRPVIEAKSRRYEVAEILNLQSVRELACQNR